MFSDDEETTCPSLIRWR